MTAELGLVNGANGVAKEEEEKVPQNHLDAEDEVDDGEEDGAPEAGAGGELQIYRVKHIAHFRSATGDSKKKKKKKKPKKKKAAEHQTEPPRVGLSKLFPDGNYPEGEMHEYKEEYVDCMLPYVSYNAVFLYSVTLGEQRPRRNGILNV